MKVNNFRFLNYEKLKRIVHNAYDEIFVYDNNYKVVYVNKACERHYGMKAEELIGSNFHNLLSEEKWYPSVLPTVYKEKKQFTIEQTSYLGKKLITTAMPLFDKNGEIEYVVMSVYDASCDLANQRILMEQKQRKHKKQVNLNEKSDNIKEIFFKSLKMEKIIRFSETIAKFDSTVLIQGESGTGKTMLSRHIHNCSNRKEGAFLSINCSAIPEQLLESELFGYVSGAFTGAKKEGKTGLIELASGGTILLDEIGELSLQLQAKILHVIQDKKYIPIGSNKIKKADVRIISATNKDLFSQVKLGNFREDLFWRLNVIDIEIPSLREREEDIELLTKTFLNQFNQKHKTNKEISKEVLDFFKVYKWPGNIRQLENLMERLVITTENKLIEKQGLPKFMFIEEDLKKEDKNIQPEEIFDLNRDGSFDLAVERFEAKIVEEAYKENNSTRKLADALRISQTKSARLIRKYIKK